MKTLNQLMLVCFLGSALFLINCAKDRIEDPQEDALNSYSSPDDYLDSKQQEEQEFVIENEDSSEPIQGNQKTKIWISKDCLEHPNGDPVEFPYIVKLVELYTAKDMIYYRMPTVSNGDILETDGEIRVRAFKDDVELKLKTNCSYGVEMSEESPKNYMDVYYGVDMVDYVDWTITPGVGNTPTPFADADTGYQALIYKLGWINCDFKIGDGTGGSLVFTSTTDELTNVRIFIFIPAHQTVMQVRSLVSDLIPDGTDVNILCIAVDGSGKLFHNYQETTVSGNAFVDVVMTEISDADLTAFLDGFK